MVSVLIFFCFEEEEDEPTTRELLVRYSAGKRFDRRNHRSLPSLHWSQTALGYPLKPVLLRGLMDLQNSVPV